MGQIIPPQKLNPAKEVWVGVTAPLNTVGFFLRNKGLFLLGVLPQFLGLSLTLYLAHTQLLDQMPEIASLSETTSGWIHSKTSGSVATALNAIAQTLIWIAEVAQWLLYPILWLVIIWLYTLLVSPLVSAVLSPLYDLIAEKAFFEQTNIRPPRTNFLIVIKGILGEVIKYLIILSLFALTFFTPVLAPLTLPLSIWFYGFDTIDRTLALYQLPVGQRFGYGTRHIVVCFALGLWQYVPLLGTLLSVVSAAAGAFATAKTRTSREEELLFKAKAEPSPT